MRNPDLPKLLREAKYHGDHVIEQAATELEKLEKIYKLYEGAAPVHADVLGILKDA